MEFERPTRRVARGFRRLLGLFLVLPLLGLLVACDEEPAAEQADLPNKMSAAAEAAAEAAANAEPSLAGTYLAGRFAESRRELSTAADYYLRLLEEDPDDPGLRRRALIALVSAGRFEPSVPLADQVLKESPDFLVARLLLAAAEIRKGDYAAAEQTVAEISRRQVGEIIAPLTAAWTRVGQAKYAEALKALEPLEKRRGSAAFRDLHAALIQDIAGDAAEAEASYLNALGEQERPPARLVQGLASFYQRQNRDDDAKALVERYMKNNSGSELLGETSRLIERGGKVPHLVGGANEGFAEALFDVASAFFRERSPRFALLYARLAMFAWPKFPAAHMLVAEVLDTQAQYAAANEVLGQIEQETLFYWPAQLRLAGNLNALEKTEKAIAAFERLATERQDDPNPLVDMGDILRSKERFEESAKAYDRAIARVQEVQAHHWTMFYSRGISLERSKNWERAEKDFLKALELEPDQPFVLNYLGYSWVERGEQLDKAQNMIEKAVAKRPNDGYIVDSLGWVLYRLSQYEEAVGHLEKAVELRPQDPVINDHLGDAYWRVGRENEARVQWNRALSLEPDKKLVPDIQAKIGDGLAEKPDKGGLGKTDR